MESPPAETPASGLGEMPERAELSEREREILVLVATGASNKDIAQQLVISPNTVKVHLRNVFAKIGVASRTEAALFAIREGLVQVPGGLVNALPPNGENLEATAAPSAEPATQPALDAATPAAESSPPAAPTPPALPGRRPHPAVWLGSLVVIALLALALGVWLAPELPPGPDAAANTALPRWEGRSELPEARSALAGVTYGNQVYAIGGETTTGVTGLAERYDPVTNEWTALPTKPVAVADVGAAVVGGVIYVPGGRLASGEITSTVEAYDPREAAWETRAPLPTALSGYALAAFEGRLYLFGGWDGQAYVDSVYVYDPDQDEWRAGAAMPSARAFAGAAVAGDRIYVLGGLDSAGPLSANEEYLPADDAAGGAAWRARSPLPEPRARLGVVSVSDIIHLIGGEEAPGEAASGVSPLKYFPRTDEWGVFEAPGTAAWTSPGLAVVETRIHVFGGRQADGPTAQHFAYQAIYTIELPVLR